MSFTPKVRKAQRLACKASIMLEGLTGEGKSGLAIALAYVLAGNSWDGVGAIDTENKSLDLFVGVDSSLGVPYGQFLVCELDKVIGFSPSNYLACRESLIAQGALAVVEDSISHAWQYQGGVLDIVSKAKGKSAHYAKDKYAVWGDEEVVREKNELLSLIRDRRVHVITTVRVKEKFEYGTGDNGKTELKSLGEQQIQQAELKYEPDLVLHMLAPGSVDGDKIIHPKVRVTKSRYAILKKNQEYDMTPELMLQLKAYLEEGTDPKELLELQRLEYVEAIKEYLDSHQAAVAIWKVMKKDSGHETTKLEDMPLDVIKPMFIRLTSD